MKIKVFKRTGKSKGIVNRIRFEGDIPGVFYGPRKKSEKIFIKGADFAKIQRKLGAGNLATVLFDLEVEQETHKALLKGIQYHRTTYEVIHIDFEIVEQDLPVNVNIPIRCIHEADCAGVKLGGILRQVIRTLKVSCLPKDIPQKFTIDVKDLQMMQSKRLSDIAIPEKVKPVANMQEVAVVVAKR